MEKENREILLRKLLTPQARYRLNTLKMVKPEMVEIIINYLLSLANSNKINIPISDETLKRILEKFSRKKEIRVKYR